MHAFPAAPATTPSAPRRGTARRARRGRSVRAAAVALAAAAALAGCGLVRFDTPPAEPASPSAAEVLRQDEAVRADRLAATVAEITAAPGVAPVLERVGAHARAHVDALGGVWVAWPEGAPEGVATQAPPTAPPTGATGRDVLSELTAGAAGARAGALSTSDGHLAAALLAVAVSRAADAADLAAALGTQAPASTAAPMTPEALGTLKVDGADVQVLDAARFALETVAARTSGETRARAVRQVGELQGLVDAALAAGAPDERRGAYDLGMGEPAAGGSAASDTLGPEQAVAVAAEQRLLAHWTSVAAAAPPGQREAPVAAAEDAAAQLRAWGGQLPALPGLG
ncbi:DUF4439 domain-containing protein [Georgenia ruanii]|nr:DUF4439 domain-containing protein [Georgenia ruanii]MPV87099.1 DUF4439 domain-containing protein [Georgenia ruanii]